MNEVINTRFAPTPMHGAAYAVAINTIGGVQAIGDCDTAEKYKVLQDTLNRIGAWAAAQDAKTAAAYQYGIRKVDADLQARLEVHENHHRVRAALETIPKPPNAQP